MKLFKPHYTRYGLISHALMVIILISLSGWFTHEQMLWRWDNLLYDAQLSLWTRPVSDDIIIIAIDDESLNQLGRWPWSRSIHAELLNILKKESPRAIGLDILFTEEDSHDPAADQALASAMGNSGNVVLPIFMSRLSVNSYPIEALPLALFTEQAAALGHVHIDLGNDGIARRVFLREGIGKPQWPHYSIALLNVAGELSEQMYQTAGHATDMEYSPMQWSRQYPYLIPYAGPTNHFPQIGYAQVLAGDYPAGLFSNKMVLVGATAEGMGDALPTPLSGDAGIMPGVEIVANVIDALRNNLHIRSIQGPVLIVITIMLVAIPLLLYPFVNPSTTLIVLFGIVISTLLLAGLLLWWGWWLPLSTAILFQVMSYPLWSWRRLDMAMRHINRELDDLSLRLETMSLLRDKRISSELEFIHQYVPIKAWRLEDSKGQVLQRKGSKVPSPSLSMSLVPEQWLSHQNSYWANVMILDEQCRIGIIPDDDNPLDDDQWTMLNGLIINSEPDRFHARYVEDLLEKKVRQVRTASSAYQQLRRIIDDSLSGMADGILICSSQGQVMLSNRRAGWYLFEDDNAEINGRSILELMLQIELNGSQGLLELIHSVIFEQQRHLAQARHVNGRDLLVELSPLSIEGQDLSGFIINLSDISLLKESERKRDEVLDFLSHDLRAPLSSMLAMIELAGNKRTLEEVQEMLVSMETSTHKTLHLAEQFLQLSRATTEEKIHFHDIDFNTVVLNAVDQLWGMSSKHQVAIDYQFAEDECWTHADADLLERAVVNLLSNAIKHSDAGQQVQVQVRVEKGDIHCCVIDHGCGIAAEEIPHLFEMFRRVQGAGVERKQGIGLGLAFVDAVIKRHSGTIDVQSKPGQWTRFCFTVPHINPPDIE